jgi:hypothetical protein
MPRGFLPRGLSNTCPQSRLCTGQSLRTGRCRTTLNGQRPLTLVADRRRTAEADRLARFETVVARIQCQKAFDDANAARDRDGSNSPAWWSELNSHFGPVCRPRCGRPWPAKTISARPLGSRGDSVVDAETVVLPAASRNRRPCSFQSQGNSLMRPCRVTNPRAPRPPSPGKLPGGLAVSYSANTNVGAIATRP